MGAVEDRCGEDERCEYCGATLVDNELRWRFGKADVEEVASALYRLFHGSEDCERPWAMYIERDDIVVGAFRRAALAARNELEQERFFGVYRG